MKHILLVLFCIASLSVIGQGNKEQLVKVITERQAEEFINQHPSLEAQMIKISDAEDTSTIAKKFLKKRKGEIFTFGRYTYKVIDSKPLKSFRASYIFLDGSKHNIEDIDSLRNVIVVNYRNGVSFDSLVQEYNMGGNTSGDLGWVDEGILVDEFESALKQHKKNEIFTVDVPIKGWYYVSLKTYNDKSTKHMTLLKVKE